MEMPTEPAEPSWPTLTALTAQTSARQPPIAVAPPCPLMHRGWHVRRIIHEPARYRLCPGPRRQPAMSRSRQGRQFIYEPVGHRLCPGTRQRLAWSRSRRVGILYANRSVTGCVPVPGSVLPGPGVFWVGSSYMHRFGLALPRGPSRRGCPASGVSASAPTAPGTIGISFGTNSSPWSGQPRWLSGLGVVLYTHWWLFVIVSWETGIDSWSGQ